MKKSPSFWDYLAIAGIVETLISSNLSEDQTKGTTAQPGGR
jgi:hypothetical protein